MAKTLYEAYKGRLAVAEAFHKQAHGGQPMSAQKKLTVAKCLENTNRFMNEAFNNSVGTQRSDMGTFKKFALNLVNVALPNLIAFDLVIVQPMSALTGYINYVQYTAGSNKGLISQGDVFNDPFRLGNVDKNYTSASVVSPATTATEELTSLELKWKPVVPGTVKLTVATTDAASGETTTVQYVDDGNGNLIEVPEGGSVTRQVVLTEENNGVVSGTPGRVVITVYDANGDVVTTTAGTVIYGKEDITDTYTYVGIWGITIAADSVYTVEYNYNNVVIPQNDLPILNAEMKMLPLLAKPRRIAIYYSQIANYQAKTDYGFDLGAQLSEKAVGELSYEIDTEIVDLLVKSAPTDTTLTFNKTVPYGISLMEHYAAFVNIVEQAKAVIYKRTKRYAPTYMLIASDILPIVTMANGWTAAPIGKINGPYMAGTLNGLKVFVSPSIEDGKFVLGVNGDDLTTSAAVYAPYMPIVPTQLLGYADGGMSQGWSTMYDLRLLNADLLVAGQVTAADYSVLTAEASSVSNVYTYAGTSVGA